MNPIAGTKPELKWLYVDDLTVDSRYQRSAQSDKSVSAIAKIAENFDWSKFTPVVVSRPTEGKKLYPVIDGQHRVLAAIKRGDIEKVPCCIVDAPTLVNQAQSFIGINKTRVRMTAHAEYYALVAAEDPEILRLKKTLDSVGVTIPRYPPMHGMTKPNECQAIGTMLQIMRCGGEGNLRFALTTILKAYPDTPGQMRSMFVKALAEVHARNRGNVDAKIAVEAVSNLDPEHVHQIASGNVEKNGGSVLNAMVRDIVREYNSLVSKDKKIVWSHAKEK